MWYMQVKKNIKGVKKDRKNIEKNASSVVQLGHTDIERFLSCTIKVYCTLTKHFFPANSEPDGDFGSVESRVTLDTFLQGCAGKVTVLVGQAGSGKTLLMSCLGQQWARGLVSLHFSHYSVFILKFTFACSVSPVTWKLFLTHSVGSN